MDMRGKPRRRSFMSVGRALPGMQDLTNNVSSNIRATDRTIDLIKEANEENGCVRVDVGELKIEGKRLFRTNSADRPWQEKLDQLASKVDNVKPCVFVLFRKRNDLLLIKYIPEGCPTKTRMLYASSMSGLKQAIGNALDTVRMEEYNVSEPSELSQDEYFRNKNIEAPLSEAEKARIEQDSAETAGAYSLLARISVNPVRLPGLGGQSIPKFIAKMQEQELPADDSEDNNDDDQADKDAEDAASEGDGSKSDEAPAEEEGPSAVKDVISKLRRVSRRIKSGAQTAADKPKAIYKLKRRSLAKEEEEAPPPPPAEEEEEAVVEEEPPVPKKKSHRKKAAAADSGPEPYPYTYEQMVKMRELKEYDEGMDVTKLETYIVDDEFEKAFKMTKDAFADLPAWKKAALKKKLKLF